jgi:hypothetical protein
MVMRMNRQAIFLPISEISREFIERSPNARAISARRVAVKSADIQVDLWQAVSISSLLSSMQSIGFPCFRWAFWWFFRGLQLIFTAGSTQNRHSDNDSWPGLAVRNCPSRARLATNLMSRLFWTTFRSLSQPKIRHACAHWSWSRRFSTYTAEIRNSQRARRLA